MSSVAFLGDCFVDSEISIKPNLGALPTTLVLNWEHAYPIDGSQSQSKVTLGIDGIHYRNSFNGKRVVAGLANNHSLDYGQAGLNKSIAVIEGNGWRSCGVVHPYAADHVNILQIDGKRIALLCYAHPSSSPITEIDGRTLISPYDEARLEAEIHAAKQSGVDYLVVYIHWGAEEVYLPTPGIVTAARQMVDAGVDLIVGHHAHVLQPIEIYKGKYIFYGIGNFYFPDFETTTLTGSTQNAFAKTQTSKNKRSIVVILRTSDMSVQIKKAVVNLKSKTVFLSEAKIKATRITSFPYYDALFKASFILGKTLYNFHALIVGRRMPRLSAFENLLKLMRERNYK